MKENKKEKEDKSICVLTYKCKQQEGCFLLKDMTSEERRCVCDK